MTFVLTTADQNLTKNHSIVLEKVEDVGSHGNNNIEFQFPPIIKTDKKSGKWEELYNTLGYEPKYQYQGAMPRSISIEAVYVVGGPTLVGGSGIVAIQRQLRTWKKYFYLKSLGESGGQGKSLPIWRIRFLGGPQGFIPIAGMGSAWRCVSYNLKFSDEWVTEGGGIASHPLISTISVELQMSTKVDVTGQGDPKQPHENLENFALSQWY